MKVKPKVLLVEPIIKFITTEQDLLQIRISKMLIKALKKGLLIQDQDLEVLDLPSKATFNK